jgi:hypothetical protein
MLNLIDEMQMNSENNVEIRLLLIPFTIKFKLYE